MVDQLLQEGEFPFTGLSSQPSEYFELIELALQRIERNLENAISQLVLHSSSKSRRSTRPIHNQDRRIFLEFGGGEYEFQRILVAKVRERLENDGWHVLSAQRYELLPKIDLLESAKRDLQNAISSDVVVVLGDGSDVNPESAALQGYMFALGRKIVLYHSGSGVLYGSAEYNMHRNLMLQHSASRIVSSHESVVCAVREVTCS
jgi:hypothetical protein